MTSLPVDEIHVWLVPLGPLTLQPGHLERLLDSHEQLRACRLRSPSLARRFVTAHAALRLILASYTGEQPETISYRYNPQGKPHLASPGPDFNLSHSGEMAAIAVARTPVGIDIETVDSKMPFQEVAERYFSSVEKSTINSLSKSQRRTAFYNCWTRKEAYLKAVASGFTLPSDCFDVSSSPYDPPGLLSHRVDPSEKDRWHIKDISLPKGFSGALATEIADPVIRLFAGAWDAPPLASPHT